VTSADHASVPFQPAGKTSFPASPSAARCFSISLMALEVMASNRNFSILPRRLRQFRSSLQSGQPDVQILVFKSLVSPRQDTISRPHAGRCRGGDTHIDALNTCKGVAYLASATWTIVLGICGRNADVL
jgi:hypothetical protein